MSNKSLYEQAHEMGLLRSEKDEPKYSDFSKKYASNDEFEDDVEQRVSILYQKHGNSPAFRQALSEMDVDFKLSGWKDDTEKSDIMKKYTHDLYTESWLQDINNNPTLGNYNQFIKETYKSPYINKKYKDFDSINVASSLMYKNNDRFTTDDDWFAKTIFGKEEKEIKGLKTERDYYQKQADEYGIPNFKKTDEVRAWARVSTSPYNTQENINKKNNIVNEKIAPLNQEIAYREANLISQKKYYQLSHKDDFAENSKYIEGKTPDLNFGDDVALKMGVANTGQKKAEELRKLDYDNMGFTPQQRETAYYIANTQGKEAAQEFIDSIKGMTDVNAANYRNVRDGDSFGGKFVYQILGGFESIYNIPDEIVNTFTGNTEYKAPDATIGAADMMVSESKGIEKIVLGGTRAVAEMLPSIGITVATGGAGAGTAIAKGGSVAAKAVFAGNVYAKSYREAVNSGYSWSESVGYGIGSSALELGLEQLSGFTIGGSKPKLSFGGKVASKVDDVFKASPKVRAIASIAGKTAGTFVGEFTEEYLADVFNPVIRNIFLGENNQFKIYDDEYVESGIIGGFTGLMLGSPALVSNTAKLFKPGSYGATVAFYNTASDAVLEAEMFKSNNKVFEGMDKKQKSEAIEKYRGEKIYEAAYDSILGYVSQAAIEGKSIASVNQNLKKDGIDSEQYESLIETAYNMANASSGPSARLNAFIEKSLAKGGTISSVTKDIITDGSIISQISEFEGLSGDALTKAVRKYVTGVQSDSGFLKTVNKFISEGASTYAIFNHVIQHGGSFINALRSGDGTVNKDSALELIANAQLSAIAAEIKEKNLSGTDAVKYMNDSIQKITERNEAYILGASGTSLERAKIGGKRIISDAEFEKAFNEGKTVYEKTKAAESITSSINEEATDKAGIAVSSIAESIIGKIKSTINADVSISEVSDIINEAINSDVFDKHIFVEKLASIYVEALKSKNASVYLEVSKSGIDISSALVRYYFEGIIPENVNANAFKSIGDAFNGITESAITQVEAARTALAKDVDESVAEGENGAGEAENEAQSDTAQQVSDITVLKSEDVFDILENSDTIYIGSDIITNKEFAIPKTESMENILKSTIADKIVNESKYTSKALYNESTDILITGNPKVDGNNYIFEIGGQYFIAPQSAINAFAKEGNVILANKSENIPWVVKNNDSIVGFIMPWSSKGVTKADVDALPYASEVLESNNGKSVNNSESKMSEENVIERKNSENVSDAESEAARIVNEESFEDVLAKAKMEKEGLTGGRRYQFDTAKDNKDNNTEARNKTEENTMKKTVTKTEEEKATVLEETVVSENEAIESVKASESESSDDSEALELTDKCELIATKHTQTGDDIYVITVKDRLSKEQYNELNQKVKAVGGYYSRFAKTPDGKAIPEFVFKSEPSNDVIKVFNDFFGESTSAEDNNTQVENKSDVKESNIKEIDTNALFGALKNAKDGDEVKLSDYEKQKTNDEVLYKQSESDIIEEKTDVEADTNDREQSGILAAESEGHITGEQSQEVQDDEEGRDTGGSDGDSGTDDTLEVSDDAQVADGEQDTAEGVRDAEPDTGHDFNGESGEHTDSERGSNAGSDVSSGKLNSHNYRITEDIDSTRPNIRDNLEAIRVLKQLEQSGKKATKQQQAILAKYKGWGGLKSAFTDYYNIQQLREVMTEEEFKAARAGVLDAFYTSTKLISGIYKGLSRLGFKGGNILEPSMGTGNFFGVMPAGISSKSNLYGVELDPITGRIAKYLYPDANIEISGFQDVKYPEGTFDAVVGNVPFVDVSIPYKGSKYMLHDYFFIKSLDTLKEGGVLAVLTSTGTLDKLNTKARHEMAKRANLIAAYRLPNDAFATNAGTSVTTDLIILQKRGDTIPFNGEPFERLGKIGNIQINEYFANHPENVLGELITNVGMYGKERSAVIPYEGKDFAKIFDKAISRLPKDLLTGNANQDPVDIQVLNASKSHFEERNGDVIFFDSDTGTVDVLSGKAKERAKAYIAVKDAYNNLLEASRSGVSKLERDALRSILNKAYDDFHTKHGNLQDKANKSLEGDSEFVKVTGIELYNPDKKVYEKSGIFTTDTIGYVKPVKADTSLDALAISVNESGTVDLKRISSLVGKSADEIVSELEGSIIETPDGGYELIPVYASGNIREKLKAVEGKEGFERNVELLKSVMPKDKAPSEIIPQLGASWIPTKYISDFIKDVFGSYYTVQVNYDPTSGTWNVEKFWSNSHTMNQKYGTSRMNAYDLFVETLNLKSAKIYDTIDDKRYFNKKETSLARQKQAEIKEAFSNWIFKDAERRSELVKIYNELFNSHRNMDYAELSKYLTFPGLKSSWKMRDYQKAAVARIVFGGNTLLAHGVGTGKTCEMIASAMEMKRMGITKKNVFVVPKHKIGDFRNDILKMYPEAKVLMATEKDFEKKNRGKLFSKIGTNDWDIVIIGHSSFGLLPVSSQTEAAYIEKQKNELEDVITRAKNESGGRIDKRFVSGLEKSLKSLEARLKEALDTKKDDTITFEELGIDGLFVDEAHNFKNLPFYTKLNLPGVKGGTSKRASDMFMKTEYLRDNGGRIVFATATPITNSVSEFYNMTRFVRPDALKEAGIYSFDSWASTFGSIETKMEMSPDGKNYRTKERFSKYNNVREMVGLFRQFADILRTGDVVKDLPKANYIDVVSPSLDFHDAYINNIIERMKRVSSGGQSREDNMLLITNDGRAMATDLRLIASQIENFTDEELDVPTSRINKAVSNIITEYKKSDKIKGTQFVFLDFGMNANDEGRYNYNLYGDLITKLIEGGIPENEIAKIGDYDTVAKKDALFKKVNDGEVRVLIGSTAKMGEGMNAQERAVALHHLNAPYRPSDIEQREGRIIRHGNINKDVNIYRYIQEKSFDSYMWQMLARKGEFINQALSDGDVSELEETDEFVLSAKTGMAVATGNPLILKKVEVDEEVKRLQGLKKSYDASIYDMQDRLAKLPGEIDATKLALSRTKEDIKTLTANNSEEFSIKLAGKVYDKRADAAKALVPLIKNKYGATGSEVIGSYRGLNLTLTKTYSGGILYIGNKSSMKVELSDSAEGNITRITNAASRFDSYAEFLSKRVTTLESELKSIKNDIDLPFKYQSQLDKAIAEQAEINAQLNFGEDNSEVIEDMSDKFKTQEELDEEEKEAEEEENDISYYFLSEEEISQDEENQRYNQRSIKSLFNWRRWRNVQRSDRGARRLYEESRRNFEQSQEERKKYIRQVEENGETQRVKIRGIDIDVISESAYNEEMTAIAELNSERGVKTRFMASVSSNGSMEFGGFTLKDGVVYICYGTKVSPWKINKHELSHIFYNSDMIKVIKRAINAYMTDSEILKLKPDGGRYKKIYLHYNGNVDRVFEEFVCEIMEGSETLEHPDIQKLVDAYWNNDFDFINNYRITSKSNSDGVTAENTSPDWLRDILDDEFYPSLADDGRYDFIDIFNEYNEKIEKYGAIPKGENPARDISVPKKISKSQPVSRFARTMMEAGVTPDIAISEFEKKILDGTMTHLVITNDAARQKAISEIKYNGFEDSLKGWYRDAEKNKIGKYELVLGMELYNQCITNKDVTNAMKIAADLTALATQAGQTLQACRVLKLMSPDGELYYLEKSIDKMNDELKNQLGDKFEGIELDEELMRQFLEAQDEKAKNDAYDKLCQNIADQIPATKRDKWNSWRYLAMLGNPRTHIRNVVGNAIFFPAIRIKNHVAAILESVTKVPIEERKRSHRKTKEAVKFAKDDFANVVEQLQGNNGKYVSTSDIENRRTIFKTKALEYLRKKNFDLLENEDMYFLKSHYVDTLARIITVRKLDVNNIDAQVLDNIRLFAIRQAQEYTYRDANALAEWLNKTQRKMETHSNKVVRAASILTEGVMPFKKTPLNIAKQGVMYSPVGIITGISKALSKVERNGDISVNDAIDDISKGLTGTGIMALGLFLSSLGIITGGDDEDGKKNAFDELVGEQSYSINLFGHSYTIDWVTPSSLPFFVGVEIFDLASKDGLTVADVLSALGGLTEPLFELSVLSGISGTIDAAKYNNTNTFVAIMTDMVTSYFMQACPTVGGQLSRIIDSQKREYYYVDKNNKILPASIQRLIGQAASKVPGMSYLFAPAVDNWGRDESYGNIFERFLENTVSPGYYSKENYTEVDDELLRLYTQTGENSVFPPNISKGFTEDGKRYDFTAKEYSEYKRDRGQRSFKYVYELINSTQYEAMNDNEKVAAIEKCYDRARDEAKLKYLGQPIPEHIDSFGRGDAYRTYSEDEAIKNGYYSLEDYEFLDSALIVLAKNNGIEDLYPTIQSDYYTIGGVKYEMTPEQHAEAQTIRGKKSVELLLDFFDGKKIRGVKLYSRCENDEDIIEAIRDIYRVAGEYTKDIMIDKVKSNKK